MAKAHPVRRWVRELLSISFWLHALVDAHILPASLHGTSAQLATSIYNTLLLTFILYYSWLTDNGWLSVSFDVGYIYVWPFLIIGKSIWKASRWYYKFFKAHTIPAPMGLIALPIKSPATQQAPTTIAAAEKTSKDIKTDAKPSVLERLMRPFSRFTLLWGILALSLTNRPMIIFVLIVTLFGASKAVYALWDLLADTSDWIEKLKGGFANQFAEKIGKVRDWEENTDAGPIAQEINGLRVFESVFSFISANRNFLARCTMVAAVMVTIPFYLYISFLFASVYVGAAHITHTNFSFGEALLDSLYIPFAFTDLPHNILIRSIAGLQAIAITLMGWNIFFRHLGGKFERLATAADELKVKFDDEIYKIKSAQVAQTVEAAKKPVVSVRPNRQARRRGSRPTC